MNRRKMWNVLWLKVRYGWKSYLFYMIATILFLTVLVLSMIFSDDEIREMQSLYMIGFLYVPVFVNQTMPTVEYSKCYYLVPRTSEERRRFIQFQNHVKMLLSLSVITLLLGICTAIRPEAFEYLFSWYLICGVSFSLAMGVNGYSTYSMKKKKKSYTQYMIAYVITVVVMIGIMMSGMVLAERVSVHMEMIGGAITAAVAAAYNLFYSIRFCKADTSYENIEKAEQRFMNKMSNTMM